VSAIILLAVSTLAVAVDAARPAYTPPPPAVSSGSIVQIIISLLLVLAAIVLVAFVLRRMNMGKQGPGNQLKVLSGIAIGQRERIVLVEIKDTWLVVGVGPGQIRTLHTMPKPEDTEAETASPNARPAGNKSNFSGMLSSALDSVTSGKRHAP
jgi:flagellar protein FliO/FliZ